MWGNIQGWVIGLILATGMALALAKSAAPFGVTPPTHEPAVAVGMNPITLAIAPAALVPADEACDAGEAYGSALAAYQQNPAAYDAFRTHASLDRLPEMSAIDLIVKATHCGSITLFRSHPAELINYSPQHPPLDSLRKLGDATLAVGMLYRLDKNFDASRKYLDAAFALGAKLFQERVTFEEMGTGMGLMRSAAQAINSVAKEQNDAALADAAEKFMKQLDTYRDPLLEAYKIIGGIDEGYAGKYAGDLMLIAQSYQADPMWRVEVLKHLGRYKYNAPTRGDELAARKLIDRLAGSGDIDPIVRAAAVAARDLTPEQHRTSR